MSARRRLVNRLIIVVAGLGIGGVASVGPVDAAGPVGGPKGPELACINPVASPLVRMRCEISGFVERRPVDIVVEGAGTVATVRPDAHGSAKVAVDWPHDRYEHHRMRAVQQNGTSTLSSSTIATAATNRLMRDAERPSQDSEADDEEDSDAAESTSPDLAAGDEQGARQVPMRVSAAVGLGAVGLGVLGLRHRKRRRFGA